MPRSREEVLKNHKFCNFYPKITSPWSGDDGFTIPCLKLQILQTKLVKIDRSLWKEDANGQRTKYDDGRQPIAIDHLSNSGDLRIEIMHFHPMTYIATHQNRKSC